MRLNVFNELDVFGNLLYDTHILKHPPPYRHMSVRSVQNLGGSTPNKNSDLTADFASWYDPYRKEFSMTPRVQINVAFLPDVAFKIKQEADRRALSVAALVREIVETALGTKEKA